MYNKRKKTKQKIKTKNCTYVRRSKNTITINEDLQTQQNSNNLKYYFLIVARDLHVDVEELI